jgi:hypothetical protein
VSTKREDTVKEPSVQWASKALEYFTLSL